jgi:glycosyltransferase involved in cell wall biosynthesis
MNKKKLCLLISTLGPGGMQKAMSLLASYFSEVIHREVHIILYGSSKEIFFEIPETIIFHQPEFEFKNSRRFLSTIKTLLYLRKEVRRINPDTILSYGEYWNSFVLLSLLGLSYPVYISDRCQPDKSLGWFHNLLRKLLYPRAAGIISQTSIAREIYTKMLGPVNIEVIGNPIEDFALADKREKEKLVLTVGRLIPSKHHDQLIDIFLSCYRPGWKLVIVGGDVAYGNMFNMLKEKIIALNADDKIELAGNISNVDDYYRKSRIFAFTSSSEGFPNVIGEAMAAGLPVIAYDCVAGPADMIDDGINGFLVPLFNQRIFAEKLSLLMNDHQLQKLMGDKAILSIRKYSPELIGKQYSDFLFNHLVH